MNTLQKQSKIEGGSSMKTVEELVTIMRRFEDDRYNITEANIVEMVNGGYINAESISDESIFSETRFDFLIPNESIVYLLKKKYSLNERYIRSLLED